ncbi:hypothetical protein TURU_065680 [Turdus rufiventris]|nr:hypothetical protein TURU_065680 [Turdus rufiventris]
MGKMMEQGPVLIITFQAQVVTVLKNHRGDVVEGDPISSKSCEFSLELLAGAGALSGCRDELLRGFCCL